MRLTRSGFVVAGALVLSLALLAGSVRSHCQIPCGIYDDPVRFSQLEEHVTTIEKSMKQIVELSGETNPNYNQLVRWVNNKETHADELTEIVTFYFMAQRVKAPADRSDRAAGAKYVKQVTLLHQMVVAAMKAKQTTDLEHCKTLRALIAEFKVSYLGKEAAAHDHDHGHDH